MIYNNSKFDDFIVWHGTSVATKGAFISNHVHPRVEIMLFVKGEAEYVVENQRYKLAPNTLIITPPTEYHFIYFLSECCEYERYYVQFEGDAFSKSIIDKLLLGKKVLQLDASSTIYKLFKSMGEYKDVFGKDEYYEFCKGLLTQLVYLTSLETSGGETVDISEADEITASVLKYIKEHVTEPLSIESIAKALYISPSKLSHKFSSYMNTGVMKYVKKKRAHIADAMLRKGMKPTVVSERCGYGDYSTFYRVYKEIFGMPPKERKDT